ncbi:MAG: Gfo/Idh/MocA family protein [Candidatus Brocadiia bacterium]
MAVQVGLIGTGGIASRHMEGLTKVENAQVIGCMDLDEERAVKAAARFPGASAFTDLSTMLDELDIEAAYVCVPPHAHGEIEAALTEMEIPFFVEKPIGNNRETPTKILEGVKDKGLITSVGYMSRYRQTVEQTRRMIQDDQPVLARGGWIGGMPGVYWWRQKDMSGGQIMEQTTHTFDLARYLLGDVENVYCVGRTGIITDVEKYSVEDASICTLEFEDGMICELSSSCAVKCGGGVSLEIFCNQCRVKVAGWDLGLEFETPEKSCTVTSKEDSVFEIEDRVFIDAVESGDDSEIKSSYEDAHKTQMVTCAANESMESGQPVQP